jgi:hemoglobin-like flavoprotein
MKTETHQPADGRAASPDSRITRRQIELIRETFALVEPRAEVVALVFYQRLFALDPSLRPLFHTNIDEQGQKLMQMLGVAVALLDQPFALVPSLEAMGRRHAGYGVEDRHYATVGAALLDTLAEGLGDAFAPEVKDAWAALYAVVADAMQRGAASASRNNSTQLHNSKI